MLKSYSKLQMNNKIFRKKHQNNIDLDLIRIQQLEEICGRLSGVSACRAVEVNYKENVIGYEYIDTSRPLIKSLKNEHAWFDLGKTLAKIHTTSIDILGPIDTEKKYSLQEFGLSASEEKFLDDLFGMSWFHGDFWYGNVFKSIDDGFIVIDPIPSMSIFREKAYFANGLLDVATMYMSLHFVHPISRQLRIDPNTYTKPADNFLLAYSKERGIDSEDALYLARKVARELAKRFISSYKRRLMPPLAAIKEFLAHNTLAKLDKNINWK